LCSSNKTLLLKIQIIRTCFVKCVCDTLVHSRVIIQMKLDLAYKKVEFIVIFL